MTQQSPRQRFLATGRAIAAVYADTSQAIGYDGRKRMREAVAELAELATFLPDTEPGQLAYGNMDDKAIAAAVRNAEKGLASAAVTLELVSQVRRLREELAAFGGPHGVTESDIRSMIGEGFHTAFRKAADSMEAAIAWKAIRDMDSEEYAAIISFTADPIIEALLEAEQVAKASSGRCAYEQYYRNAGQEPPPWDLESETVRQGWIAIAELRSPAGDTAEDQEITP